MSEHGPARYLDCPACEEPCTAIPSCQEAHDDCFADAPYRTTYSWCEDRCGTCECGAQLRVLVDIDDDGGYAYLEECEDV